MQTEVTFLGHIVSRADLVCDTGKVSVVRAWHASGLTRNGSFNPEGSYICLDSVASGGV